MIEAMLEPFMRTSLGTGQRAVSFAFLLSGMVYLPFAPIAGWVRWKTNQKRNNNIKVTVILQLTN